jgi:hypothetical protein
MSPSPGRYSSSSLHPSSLERWTVTSDVDTAVGVGRKTEIALVEIEGELHETVYLGAGYGSVRPFIAYSITVGGFRNVNVVEDQPGQEPASGCREMSGEYQQGKSQELMNIPISLISFSIKSFFPLEAAFQNA